MNHPPLNSHRPPSPEVTPKQIRPALSEKPGANEVGRLVLLLTPALGFFATLALVILIGTLSENEEPLRVDLGKRVDVTMTEAAPELTYAYLPQYSHAASFQRHHLLVDYLRRATGLSIHQSYPDTFEDHIKMVGDGIIDISFVNPFVYIKLNQRFGAQAFARISGGENETGFWGEILVRADNKTIQTLEDLRGKRWLAVDPSSAGGYLFPLGHFLEHGLRKRDFAEVAFAPGPGGKQEKVVLGVLSGKYDVGTVRDGTSTLLQDRIDVSRLRVLTTTREYPNWLFAARKGLPPATINAIQAAMLALDPEIPEHRAILDAARFKAILAADDRDFERVRSLVARLEEEGEVVP